MRQNAQAGNKIKTECANLETKQSRKMLGDKAMSQTENKKMSVLGLIQNERKCLDGNNMRECARFETKH